MAEETKEPEEYPTIPVTHSDVFTFSVPKTTTYRLKPHNIRTFSDLQDLLETWGVKYVHNGGEDHAAKHPHLWEREE